MSKKNKKNVILEIAAIRRLSFFENDFRDMELKQEEFKKGELALNTQMIVNEKKEQVTFFMSVYFFINKNKKQLKLFGTKIIHIFNIIGMNENFEKQNNIIKIPENILNNMLGKTISCLRGILVASINNHEYETIFLPLIYPEEVIKNLEVIEHNI